MSKSKPKLFQDEVRIHLNSFDKAVITLTPKPDKDITRKLQTNIVHGYRCKNSSTKHQQVNPST